MVMLELHRFIRFFWPFVRIFEPRLRRVPPPQLPSRRVRMKMRLWVWMSHICHRHLFPLGGHCGSQVNSSAVKTLRFCLYTFYASRNYSRNNLRCLRTAPDTYNYFHPADRPLVPAMKRIKQALKEISQDFVKVMFRAHGSSGY